MWRCGVVVLRGFWVSVVEAVSEDEGMGVLSFEFRSHGQQSRGSFHRLVFDSADVKIVK